MTPREKAMELVGAFFNNVLPDAVENDKSVGKKCALICVDVAIDVSKSAYRDDGGLSAMTGIVRYIAFEESPEYKYWLEVKQEIEKP